jgi:transcriptional regulator with XRE-family HTH domain
VSETLLTYFGRLLAEHRVRAGHSQRTLANYSGMSNSKISKIETGIYNGLSVLDYSYLIDDLNLELSVRLFRKGVMTQTQTGVLEYYSEASTGAAHCSGQGFTIVWQKGALCTQSDRNGATVEDILIAAYKRLEEFEHGDFSCAENQLAMEYLTKAKAILERRQYA